MLKNIQSLKSQFCTPTVLSDPISQSSQWFIDSYLFLVHAEFESYIETIVLNKIEKDLSDFMTKNKLTMAVACCASYSDIPHHPSQDINSLAKNSFKTILNENVALFREAVKLNNGIKQNNIVPLLAKVGFNFDAVDHTEFLEVDNFGQVRGDIAHKSIGIRTPITISDEELRIQRLLKVFSDIDKNI